MLKIYVGASRLDLVGCAERRPPSVNALMTSSSMESIVPIPIARLYNLDDDKRCNRVPGH